MVFLFQHIDIGACLFAIKTLIISMGFFGKNGIDIRT